MAKSKRYWGTQRVARVCQVSPATVANWIDQGLLKGHKTPTGRRRVIAADLAAFLRAHEMAVPPELEHGGGRDIVVVVDDDPGYRKALVLTIARSDLDVDVVEAATGVDALLEIGRVQPSLIVLDYSLPDLNAPQVIERLLEPGRRLDAEVLVVTGGMPDTAVAELKRVGVKVIVNKVEGMPAVVEAMRQALKRRKAA
ncbi:MAG TPA: response regulator [Gemmatimonadales bacterium]|nr:response regulator [Gemmatimonadales bacterium]